MLIFWHRRDLRISDNLGLMAAYERNPKVVGLFCLDPQILQADDIAPARIGYLLGCLGELAKDYQAVGSQLLILQGKPSEAIPQLAVNLRAEAVFWNLDVEPYSQERDRSVKIALESKGIVVNNFWDQLLHAPETVVTQADKPYTVYTPFWKNWSQQPKIAPVGTLKDCQGLTLEEQEIAVKSGVIPLPTASDLGFDWDYPLVLAPGTAAATAKLEEFSNFALSSYQEQRNFPAIEGTSLLSPALKFGAIGIRTIWQTAQEAYLQSRSDETRANIQTWQQELAWREFYQHCLYFFPELAQGAYRKEFQDFPWDNNEDHFQAWCQGKTGYPIVDAAMRQLNESGWMHNRCRMIVASFLTKDLIIDWRWGEKYFMQKLIDGDLAANNGGWQWSASSGMDPKPLRIFNPTTQAQKFDPEGEYMRLWLPELSSVDPEYLVTGKISRLERYNCDYPEPIVDHNQQQRRFKMLYQQQKLSI